VNSGQDLKIEINPKNGTLKAWALLKVVRLGQPIPRQRFTSEKAQPLKPGRAAREIVEKEIDPSTLAGLLRRPRDRL